MHPYGPINGSWYALLGGGGGGTDIFLATAPALAGPWKVLKPLSFLDIKPPYKPVYVENPVVNKLPPSLGGGYVCLVDLSDVTGFAISYSANGLDWTPQLREVPVPVASERHLDSLNLALGYPCRTQAAAVQAAI